MRRPTLPTLVIAALALIPAAAHAQCTPPIAPTGVSATAGCNRTTITWNGVPTATQYRLVGSSFSGEVFNVTLTSTSFVYIAQPGIPANNFTVTAINSCAAGPAAPTVQAQYASSTPLIRVISLAASDGTSCADITVTWGDVTNEGTNGYRITRTAANQPTVSFDVRAGESSFVDSSALPGIVYTYAVAPINPCGVGLAASNTGFRASATPITPVPVAAARNATAVLTAPILSSGTAVASYAWRRGVDPTGAGGTPVADGPRIMGAATDRLTIANLRPEDASLYACSATVCGTTVSSGAVALVVTTACSADFDGSGSRTIADIFAFLSAWFAGCP
ncbi:MAG: immunoglobulin domain-containing protein [Phycisphaerales bacterium]|nr:immunoglobulin domain-containing protein [Phycisphaerales bacterium]